MTAQRYEKVAGSRSIGLHLAVDTPRSAGFRNLIAAVRRFEADELIARDKASLDLFWLKDDSLENLDDLPPPDVLQPEIIEHLEAALAAFRDVASGLPGFARAADGK